MIMILLLTHYQMTLLKFFPNSNLVGASFGVVIVNFNGESFEIASYRSDSSFSKDGRHPDSVKLGVTMKEDSERRDFTINAMYYDPINNKFYDFHSGVNDIENRVISFVGDASKRIEEDYLRMLRAIRFANRFVFDYDYYSERSITYNMHKIINISAERIGDELNKMFLQTKPNFNLHMMLHFVDCMASNKDISNYEFCQAKIKEYADELINDKKESSLPKPLINGDDLIALGYKQGPIFKIILNDAMDMQLEGYERDYTLKSIIKTYSTEI